jgi:PAS domain S-box-containing protein
MEEMIGISAAELLGKHPLDAFPFLKDAGVIDSIDRVLNGIADSAIEYPYHVPSTGAKGWASNTNSAMYNSKGEIIGVISTIENITQRKQMEQNLLQKNEDNAFLTSFSYKLADSSSRDIIKDIILPGIKKHTNAVYAHFAAYDTNQKALVIKHIEADNAFLDMIFKTIEKKMFSTFYPVSEEEYQLMMSNEITVLHSMTELSFGAISKKIDNKFGIGTSFINELDKTLHGSAFGSKKYYGKIFINEKSQKEPLLLFGSFYEYLKASGIMDIMEAICLDNIGIFFEEYKDNSSFNNLKKTYFSYLKELGVISKEKLNSILSQIKYSE